MSPDELLLKWPVLAVLFVFGTCIGSFLNVVIYRMPRGLSVNKPARSFCTTSGKTIPWHDNIPVVSYLLLGGKSRFDGKPISVQYPVVEFLTGLCLVLLWVANAGHWISALLMFLLTCFLIAASGIDFEHYIIPNEISKTSIVLGVAVSAAWPDLHRTDSHVLALAWSLLGAVIGYWALWLVGWAGKLAFKKEAMGMGDMKLLAGVGAFLGTQAVFFTIFSASMVGAIVGVVLIATGRKEMSSRIPFGPYLALGAFLWMAGGFKLWQMYLDFVFRQPEAVRPAIAAVLAAGGLQGL